MAKATRRFQLISALLLGTASLSAQAKAQDASSPAPGPADQSAPVKEDEEIVVTAQRREQQLTDVGISITALPEKVIEESRISQIENIAAAIPNVDIKEQVPGAIPVVTIRGIGLDDFSSTNSPSAGLEHFVHRPRHARCDPELEFHLSTPAA
jgi:iron complex outermembrane receptor protein